MRIAPLLLLVGCAAASDRPPAAPAPVTSASKPAAETATFVPAGPQSYTPDARPEPRDRAVRQLWSVSIGRTDERTTMMFADGAVWIGAKQGKLGAAGVYVIDGATGARRALLPAVRGDVVGIAMDGSRVYSTALEGELALTTAAGAVVFRVRAPAPIVTPPTLLDIDGDGALEVAVGDGRGNVTVFDGKNGKLLWTRPLGGAIGAGLAAADLDGDGKADLVAGTEEGRLFALRGRTGAPLWQAARSSPFRAAPVLCNVDANGKLEVIAGAYEGDLAIFDGATGRERWSQREDGHRREPHAAAGRDAARADGPSREGRRRPLRAGARPRISFAGGVGFCVAGARDDGAIAAPAIFADIDPRGSVHQKESEDHEEAEAST